MRSAISRTIKGIVATGAVAGAIAGVGLAGVAPAQAAGKNGYCEYGELCLYYLSNPTRGPIFDLYYADDNFADDYFPGTYIPADNNTEVAYNRDTYTWYVYTGAFRGGTRGYVSPGTLGNFTSTFKNTVSSAYYYL
jgi:hypothetical protein